MGKAVSRKRLMRKVKSKKREVLAKGCELNLPADSQVHFEGYLSDIVKETAEEKETHIPKSMLKRQTSKMRHEKLNKLTIKNILTLFKQVKSGIF